MFCTKCGKELSPPPPQTEHEVFYCTQCGARINDSASCSSGADVNNSAAGGLGAKADPNTEVKSGGLGAKPSLLRKPITVKPALAKVVSIAVAVLVLAFFIYTQFKALDPVPVADIAQREARSRDIAGSAGSNTAPVSTDTGIESEYGTIVTDISELSGAWSRSGGSELNFFSNYVCFFSDSDAALTSQKMHDHGMGGDTGVWGSIIQDDGGTFAVIYEDGGAEFATLFLAFIDGDTATIINEKGKTASYSRLRSQPENVYLERVQEKYNDEQALIAAEIAEETAVKAVSANNIRGVWERIDGEVHYFSGAVLFDVRYDDEWESFGGKYEHKTIVQAGSVEYLIMSTEFEEYADWELLPPVDDNKNVLSIRVVNWMADYEFYEVFEIYKTGEFLTIEDRRGGKANYRYVMSNTDYWQASDAWFAEISADFGGSLGSDSEYFGGSLGGSAATAKVLHGTWWYAFEGNFFLANPFKEGITFYEDGTFETGSILLDAGKNVAFGLIDAYTGNTGIASAIGDNIDIDIYGTWSIDGNGNLYATGSRVYDWTQVMSHTYKVSYSADAYGIETLIITDAAGKSAEFMRPGFAWGVTGIVRGIDKGLEKLNSGLDWLNDK